MASGRNTAVLSGRGDGDTKQQCKPKSTAAKIDAGLNPTEKERLIKTMKELVVNSDKKFTMEFILKSLTKHIVDNREESFKKYMCLSEDFQSSVTPIEILSPSSFQPQVVNIVDFASMTPNEVRNYDGRYGGEELYRAKERLCCTNTTGGFGNGNHGDRNRNHDVVKGKEPRY